MFLPKRPIRLLTLVAFLLLATLFTYSVIFSDDDSGYRRDIKKLRDDEGWVSASFLAEGVANVIDTRREPTQKHFDLPQVIHKTSPLEESDPATMSWYYANPGEIHRHYNDHKQRAYVLKRFPFRTVELYKSLSHPTARADVFRYLVMQREGGVYADHDTTCLAPITNWIPAEFECKDINVVVGIEVDELNITAQDEIDEWGWAANFQFCQWTLMSRPDHPVWSQTIEYVIDNLLNLARERGVDEVKDLNLTNLDLVKTTGPGPFTRAMLDHLGVVGEDREKDLSALGLRGLKEPKLINDVLVMPVSAFAPNQRHSGSLKVSSWDNLRHILIMHGFQTTHPTERAAIANSLKRAAADLWQGVTKEAMEQAENARRRGEALMKEVWRSDQLKQQVESDDGGAAEE